MLVYQYRIERKVDQISADLYDLALRCLFLFLWRPNICMRHLGPRGSVLRESFLKGPLPVFTKEYPKLKKHGKLRKIMPMGATGFDHSTSRLRASSEHLGNWWKLAGYWIVDIFLFRNLTNLQRCKRKNSKV